MHTQSLQSCSALYNPWTVAHQAPLSTEFFRQEYWNGLPYPSPRDLPNPGLKLCLLYLLPWWVGSSPLAPPKMSTE